MIGGLLDPLSPQQLTAIVLVALVAASVTTIVVVSVVSSSWANSVAVRARAALTGQMIDRGMSPDEIAQVLGGQGHDLPGEPTRLPCACEAVVEDDGEWSPALILQVAGGRYYVHHVGRDMDENEWVDEDRVRFPADSPAPSLGGVSRNGVMRKPPVETEV